jgi:hypothetical protein
MSTAAQLIRFRSTSAPERVDVDKGIIYGVSAMQMVQPKGHPVAVDQATLEAIARLGNARIEGIKSHFKHRDVEAGEDALGTQVARVRNFRVVGDKVLCDVHMLASSKISPNGNLHDYVLKFASESPEDFGLSVIMRFARAWKMANGSEVIAKTKPSGATTELPFARPSKLSSLDFVDDPAANEDGLFSVGDSDPDESTSTTGNTMKIANDRLAALKTEFAAFSSLILDSALAGDDEVQLRAKIADARLKTLSDEVLALKAKSEKDGADHVAALKAGGGKDPGASDPGADPAAALKAKWEGLTEDQRGGYANDFEAFGALQKIESGKFKPQA